MKGGMEARGERLGVKWGFERLREHREECRGQRARKHYTSGRRVSRGAIGCYLMVFDDSIG